MSINVQRATSEFQSVQRLTRSRVDHRRFARVGSFCRRQHNHLDSVRTSFHSTYRDMSHLIFEIKNGKWWWCDLIRCKWRPREEMIHDHLPGKQGLAYWQVSVRRKFCGSWQAAQFSMSDWRRLMSPCWLAMSCWSFLTSAIKSLMPRNKFSETIECALRMREAFKLKSRHTITVAMDDWNVATAGQVVRSEVGPFAGSVVLIQVTLSVLLRRSWNVEIVITRGQVNLWEVAKRCS